MSLGTFEEYLSIGGNRHTAASAWCPKAKCLAYGADQHVALWHPLKKNRHGVHFLLRGHTDKVTALTFSRRSTSTAVISGAANGELVTWDLASGASSGALQSRTKAHEGAINVVAASDECEYFITGGADTLVKIWKYNEGKLELAGTIEPKPRLIPLALALGAIPNTPSESGFFVAVAGTRNEIQMYAVSKLDNGLSATLSCSLTGHEGWIRSLALRGSKDGGYILASTSHDKYVRLWLFSTNKSTLRVNGHSGSDVPTFEPTLTAKVKSVGIGDQKYSITFEALLLGHDDWVYAADWCEGNDERLLTASADGTLAIWEPDESSGIWVSETRLGEISGQKGATTATGSSGGFWAGKWVCDDNTTAVVSLGRTGSWRIWHYDTDTYFWDLKPGIGGHIGSANSICWSPNGDYLLSTSSDQTTRLHVQWVRDGTKTWHEFSRCQIHGYDCNVVTCTSSHQFASGADEKLLRVFNEPKELADALHRLCQIDLPQNTILPETAAIPVLGLSNKEMGEPDDIIEAGPRRGDDEYAAASALAGISIRGIVEPPTEDLLSRHTLWPEHEKLYGHGYEISEAAFGNGVLATACKASSLEHATIRIYDPENDWREVKPPLAAHSLTVTRLAFSLQPEQYLLSVGRDRQWTVFKKNSSTKQFQLLQAMPKAHTRMILDAAWSPVQGQLFFASAGRDKTVKIWDVISQSDMSRDNSAEASQPRFELRHTLTRPSPVTALSFTCSDDGKHPILAAGEEDGTISLHVLGLRPIELKLSHDLERNLCLTKTVSRLAWRPKNEKRDDKGGELAVASSDGLIRILRLDI